MNGLAILLEMGDRPGSHMELILQVEISGEASGAGKEFSDGVW